MARGHWIALGSVAATALAGCGGPSDEEMRTEQARYAKAAGALCEKANREIARDNSRPKFLSDLTRSVTETRRTLEFRATGLHKLKTELGDSSSAQIDAFDGALNPFVAAVDRITETEDPDELAERATALRRRGTTLFKAAQSAKLTRCGRGGNAIAERVVFFQYRDGYIKADQITRKRLRRLRMRFRGASGDDAVLANKRVTRAGRVEYRATGRLEPPRTLRSLHQSVRRAFDRTLTTREALDDVTSFARFQTLRARLKRQAKRYYAFERRLRVRMNR